MTETTAMASARASVPTEHASRYLQQLCKHWSHKFAVTFDAQRGVVPFGHATCTFDADDGALHLRLDCAPDALERMEQVVADHLKRFAFRETLAIAWTRD